MKWDAIEPQPGKFRFESADRYVEFGERNGMFIIGHTLVWHSQTPGWVFKDAKGDVADRETLLARMREHIQNVVGRYQGRIKGWDVVNEALEEDGSLRKSSWFKIIGDDYIVKAFEFAHAADPKAELYYNDYGIEDGAKRDGAIVLLKKLKDAGTPVTAVGIQGHLNLNWPSPQALEKTIAAFGQLGLKVMITELDVDVLPARSRNTSADVRRSEAAAPRAQSLRRRPARGRATGTRAEVCRAFCRVSQASRDGEPGDVLGRHRWRLLVEQLADPRTRKLSTAFRPRSPPQARVRRGD